MTPARGNVIFRESDWASVPEYLHHSALRAALSAPISAWQGGASFAVPTPATQAPDRGSPGFLRGDQGETANTSVSSAFHASLGVAKKTRYTDQQVFAQRRDFSAALRARYFAYQSIFQVSIFKSPMRALDAPDQQ